MYELTLQKHPNVLYDAGIIFFIKNVRPLHFQFEPGCQLKTKKRAAKHAKYWHHSKCM